LHDRPATIVHAARYIIVFCFVAACGAMLVPRPIKLRPQRDINLWRIPLAMSLGAVALFGITLVPDVLDADGIIRIPSWFTMGGIDDARSILSATMGAVATVLALIFSVALLVLSMVATLFGPRILYRFLQDWVTQATIGSFMATFVYLCLVFLVTHQNGDSTFIPQVCLITSWVLVVGSFGLLVYYSHRIASSIQNPDLVGRIADDVYPAAASARMCGAAESSGEAVEPDKLARDAAAGAAIQCPKSGYIQHVEHATLVTAASKLGATVILHFRPGQFVLRGERLASVTPAARGSVLEATIDRAVAIGRHRTLTQDSEFAIAQIVEIAIRALSPAVNDTFTGVACVDWLADALLALSEEPPVHGSWHDPSGALRVWIPEVKLDRLVRLAFDQIRQASGTTPAVLIRQLDAIGRLAARMPEPARRALAAEADAIRDQATGLVALDRSDLDAAFARARAAFDSGDSASAARA
jgi:uncharacterized membrane protein